MPDLKNINKVLEHLAYNQKGNFLELQRKINWSQISLLKNAGFFNYDVGKNSYEFTQKGVDYYSENIYSKGEIKGIFKNLRRVFN